RRYLHGHRQGNRSRREWTTAALRRARGPAGWRELDPSRQAGRSRGVSTQSRRTECRRDRRAGRARRRNDAASRAGCDEGREFVEIAEVHSAPPGSVVVLHSTQSPLRHYHFGGPDPGPAHDGGARGVAAASSRAGEIRNFGVDERAEVALISRNVVLTAKTPDPQANAGDPNLHWGGELKFCKGYAGVALQGVELEKFGKEALGSYPIHFHMANEDATAKPPIPPNGKHLIDANSIHHSYNKCATLHSTSNITLSNNICARIVGHIFYEEIGDEYNINFKNNLGLGAMANNFGIVGSAATTSDGLVKGWWEGDYLARINGY